MQPSITELLLAGAKLMLIRMGIVFLFLALLVWMIGVTSNLVHRYTDESSPSPGLSFPPDANSEPEDAELVAVIAAAIHHYENQ